jgi:D-cysteine desulfhydrase
VLHRYPSSGRLRLAAPYLMARYRPWYVPAGGSNPTGALGYVDVALEIAEQVEAGTLPEPATVAVPVGSGGTAAGLALGLRLAGLRSRVLGVVVNDLLRLDPGVVARLAGRTGAVLTHAGLGGVPAIDAADLDLPRDWLGGGYGVPTAAGVAEVARASEVGLSVEPVYSGKALAAIRALDDAGELPGPVLWLSTHGPRP